MSLEKSDSKLYNIFFFGDIKSSEKLFENLTEKKDLTKELEIHGEKIKLNIIEHPDVSIISNEDKKTNGILLFYNVSDIDSFNKLKETIEKIIDMNKYEMPLIVIGNNPSNQERKISVEEAQKFLEKYGIKYHEINNEENIKNILNDLGEQVLFKEIVEKKEIENNNSNIKEDNNKNENEKIIEEDIIKNEESLIQNIEIELNVKETEETITKTPDPKSSKDKRRSVIINKPFKPKRKSEQSDVKEKKTLAQIKREELVREKLLKREKEMEQWDKKKEREGIELKKKKEKESKIKMLEKVKEDKETQKRKVKEVKEEFSNQKKERYEKSKKEREEEEKKSLQEKEKNKAQLEQKLKSERANFKKLLLQKEKNEKDILEQKRAQIFSPSSNNSRIRPKKKKNSDFDLDNKSAILNKTISHFYIEEEEENPKIKKTKNLDNSVKINTRNYQTIKKNSTTMNIFKNEPEQKNKTKKSKTSKEGGKKNKVKEENKKEENEKEENEKENKEIIINQIDLEKKEKENQIKNELEQNYLNNSEIYRCLFCSRIPLININQYEHLINIKCCCKNKHYNNGIFNYDYFTQKSLDHPMTEKNIKCHYCQKKLSELKEEDNINMKFCELCNYFICSKNDLLHDNYHSLIKHQELKEKYKKIFTNKNIVDKSKALKARKSVETKNKLATPSKGTKLKRRNTTQNEEINKNKNSNKTEVIQDKDKEKKKEKDKIINVNEIPLYMMDSCCIEHNNIYKSYCCDCNKNICLICEEKHKEHYLINLSEIEIKEDDISNIKNNLEKEINDLKNINDEFFDLIEKLKKEFIYLYKLKQKEIEIKQKIIHDYEKIRYNYNSIKNVQNIINNDKNTIYFNNNKNTRGDLLEKLNSIFSFMKNNNDIIYNEKEILQPNIDALEISSMIKLNNNNIAISSFNGFLDIYNDNFELILRKKIFDNNEVINDMIELKNGDIALIGKKIKILKLDIENKICDIIHEINNENEFVDLISDFGNNYLITYDSNQELKLFKNFKFIKKYKRYMNNIGNIYKISDNSFITSSILNNNINLFKFNFKNIVSELIHFPLSEEMHLKKGKNSLIRLNEYYFVFIYEIEKENKILEEKFEESKNNEEIKLENGLCLIELRLKNNNYKIIQKIKNLDEKKNYTKLFGFKEEEFLILNGHEFFEIWKFDIINKNIYLKNKIDILYNDGIIINAIYLEETKELIIQTNKKIFMLSNY